MNICVYCSSSNLVSSAYRDEANLLGHYIGGSGNTLVYGGATGGLMDVVAEGAQAEDADIVGIVPELIVERGRKSDLPTQLFVVEDMAERKEMMKEYADVFVALAGGYGTLDELFDVLVTGMLGYHDKPVILVNSQDYYSGLLSQFEKMEKEHMGYKSDSFKLQIVPDAKSCIELLKSLDQ